MLGGNDGSRDDNDGDGDESVMDGMCDTASSSTSHDGGREAGRRQRQAVVRRDHGGRQ